MYLVLTTSLLYLAFSGWGNDDPYITYRYAHNLAAGKGFVYNTGEQVLSTTTPLFTTLLALATPVWGKLTHSTLPQLANLIGAFSLALGGLFLWLLANLGDMTSGDTTASVGVDLHVCPRDGSGRWVGLTGLVLYPIFPLLVATLGSEIPLYLAFCLGALVFYNRQNLIMTAILTVLAILTRPDGFLLAGLLIVDHLYQHVRQPTSSGRRSQPWLAGLVFVGLVLPWFLFAWCYFGSPIPVTLAAKQHQGLMAISQRFAPGLFTILRPYRNEWFFWIEAALVLVGVIWVMATLRYKLRRDARWRDARWRDARWRDARWRLLFIWTMLYFGAYTLLGVSRYFWYYAALVPSFIVAVGFGIAACADNGFWDRIGRIVSSTKITGFAMAALIAILAVGQVARLAQIRSMPDTRLAFYRAVGEWLKDHTSADARIGTLEVGIIGYYSQRAMIDFAGLLQPEVAAQIGSETTYADSAQWATERYTPDILVLQEGLFPDLERDYADRRCGLVKQFPGEPFGYAYNLNIYRCQG